MSSLVVYYDLYHTPLAELKTYRKDIVALVVDLVCNQIAEDDINVSNIKWDHQSGTNLFVDEYLTRAIKANALYQSHYNLSAALCRPALAQICAEAVNKHNSTEVIHGFAGNDQLRFESALLLLCPEITILSVTNLIGSRTEANDNGFTRSTNIWGQTLEAGSLSDPWFDSASLLDEPEKPDVLSMRLVLSFEKGLPVAIDGEQQPLLTIIEYINAYCEKYALGYYDLIEDGYVGLKSRALYSFPAADIILTAHQDLERFVSSRKQNSFKATVDTAWTELVYDGGWHDPQRLALEAYITEANRWVSGDVSILLRSGQFRVVGRRSDNTLYSEDFAIYRAGQDFGGELITGLSQQNAALAKLVAARSRIEK